MHYTQYLCQRKMNGILYSIEGLVRHAAGIQWAMLLVARRQSQLRTWMRRLLPRLPLLLPWTWSSQVRLITWSVSRIGRTTSSGTVTMSKRKYSMIRRSADLWLAGYLALPLAQLSSFYSRVSDYWLMVVYIIY